MINTEALEIYKSNPKEKKKILYTHNHQYIHVCSMYHGMHMYAMECNNPCP